MQELIYAIVKPEYKGKVWDVEKERSAQLHINKRYKVGLIIKSQCATDVWLDSSSIIFPIDAKYFIFENKNHKQINI